MSDVQMEPVDDALRSKGQAVGLQVLPFADDEQACIQKPVPVQPPNRKDIATCCYTSGTTGNPKGTLLTHQSLLSDIANIKNRFSMTKEDVHLSYLPLPHVFERCVQIKALFHGARLGFYQGETLKILEDMQALRPAIFPFCASIAESNPRPTEGAGG